MVKIPPPSLLRSGTIPQPSAGGAVDVPGYRLHPLKGDRKGQWAVWVSGNWRLVFEFDGENAANVELIDYH